MEKWILDDEKSPLTDENKITINELCICMSSVLLNICQFNFNQLVIEEPEAATAATSENSPKSGRA